jgi:hypothetical protein
MRIRLLAPLEDLELERGDEVELADNRAIALIQAGFAVPAKLKIERAVKTPMETRKEGGAGKRWKRDPAPDRWCVAPTAVRNWQIRRLIRKPSKSGTQNGSTRRKVRRIAFYR